jgi:hypothetical protein
LVLQSNVSQEVVESLKRPRIRRRGQRAFINWDKFSRLVDRFFPPIRILHPLPCHRFDARTRAKVMACLVSDAVLDAG